MLADVALPPCANASTTLRSTSTRSDSAAGRGRALPDGASGALPIARAPASPLVITSSVPFPLPCAAPRTDTPTAPKSGGTAAALPLSQCHVTFNSMSRQLPDAFGSASSPSAPALKASVVSASPAAISVATVSVAPTVCIGQASAADTRGGSTRSPNSASTGRNVSMPLKSPAVERPGSYSTTRATLSAESHAGTPGSAGAAPDSIHPHHRNLPSCAE
mmetsp:Transcript_15907/g.28528  ORF Transcript_15907/g.28528 Transcript_15907/m.28528 type:complete len:219 (-) Transcript_15907:1241-1897(-)